MAMNEIILTSHFEKQLCGKSIGVIINSRFRIQESKNISRIVPNNILHKYARLAGTDQQELTLAGGAMTCGCNRRLSRFDS